MKLCYVRDILRAGEESGSREGLDDEGGKAKVSISVSALDGRRDRMYVVELPEASASCQTGER